MLRDLHIALRSLARRPAFASAVILTLGLGLGANAALFSLVDAVILRGVPYPDGHRLVAIFETVDRGETIERRTVSYPDFESIRDGAPAFEDMAVWAPESFVVTGGERAVRLPGERVSASYFDVLGIEPSRGHGFTGEPNQVLLGHELWQTTFGGDPEILGRSLSLGGEPYTVVGVMPAGFGGVMDGRQLWAPVSALSNRAQARDNRFLGMVARLAPEASLDLANHQLGTIFSRLEAEFPDDNAGYSARAVPLKDELVGDLQGPVRLLLAAVGLLLLIACANVANLLLVHRVRQRRQVAIRLAVGARAWDLARWNLMEVLVIALLGGGLGLILATWGLAVLMRFSPVALPDYATIDVNENVVIFGFALAVVVALVLGLATAIQIRRDAAPALLRLGATTGEGPRGGARRGLLAFEVALALVVAVGAVSALHSWRSMARIDPGFEPHAAVFQITLPDIGEVDESPAKPDPALAALRRQVLDTISDMPGVESAALASDTPLQGGYSATVVSAEGAVQQPGTAYGGGFRTYIHVVSEHYFESLRIPLLRGENFAGVRPNSVPVALVSERLAQRLWPGERHPIGRRFKLGPPPSAEDLAAIADDPERSPWITVAGVVGEVRHRNLVPNPERIAEDPDLYLPLEQWPRRSLAGIVRPTAGDSALVLPDLRRRLEALHAEMPVYALRTLADDVGSQTARSRFGTVLMSLFAMLSLGLAALGIYSVMAYQVSERTREIGIRMALGADRRTVIGRVLREGMQMAILGLIVGCGVAIAVARLVIFDETLYGIDPSEPTVLVPALALLAVIAFTACLLPARKASRVDPLVALRQD